MPESPPSSQPNEVAVQLQSAKRELLDMTFRNRLLRFRPSSGKHVKVTSPGPLRIFQRLVDNEGSFGLKAGEANADTVEESLEEELDDGARGPRSMDLATEPSDLRPRLLLLEKHYTEFLDEQGYNALFLALGMLQWKDADDLTIVNNAPLVLLPVILQRTSDGTYSLKWSEEEPMPNLSLQNKLTEQGVRLPAPESLETTEELSSYFAEVLKSINKKPDWKVRPDVYLGFFSFSKFTMYMDLEELGDADESKAPELLRALLAPGAPGVSSTAFALEAGDVFDPDRADETLDWRATRLILDADPSQIAVVQDAKRNKSLVVQGPPGTGKSQTIANLVAELIAQNKRVLFVAEKKEALYVVKQSLDRVGLGVFCLELHSTKSTKKAVYADLQKALAASNVQVSGSGYDASLEAARNTLNAYATAMREPVHEWSNPVQVTMGRVEMLRQRAEKSGRKPRRLNLRPGAEEDQNARTEGRTLVAEYKDVLAQVGNPAKNPWRMTHPRTLLPGQIEPLREQMVVAANCMGELAGAFLSLQELSGVVAPSSLERWNEVRDAVALMSRVPRIEMTLLQTPEAPSLVAEGKTLLERLHLFQGGWRALQDGWNESILDAAPDKLLADLAQSYGSFAALRPAYRRSRRAVVVHRPSAAGSNHEALIAELKTLATLARTRSQIRASNQSGRHLFGEAWVGEKSDERTLRDAVVWMNAFLYYKQKGAFRDDIHSRLHSSVDEEALTTIRMRIGDLAPELIQTGTTISDTLRPSPDSPLAGDPIRWNLARGCEEANVLAQNIESLYRWSLFSDWLQKTRIGPFPEVEQMAAQGELSGEELGDSFELALATAELDEAFRKRPILQRFSAPGHDRCVSDFQRLDAQLSTWARDQIVSVVLERQRKYHGMSIPTSALGILKAELNKKRKHRSIRHLLRDAAPVIQDLKPCFMMSPISVAQFLEPGKISFDVVVFDEASQIKPHDALGAIMRAKQIVVVGDKKQLPPTSFFDNVLDDGADDDEEPETDFGKVGDVESILQLCESRFPSQLSRMLRWHYRSKHESLITASNREFYDNQLLTFPSASETTDELGLKFEHVPEGIYDRGKSKKNPGEAKRVAQDVLKHLQRYGGRKSLGVVAMSMAQQRAIDDELEGIRLGHPEFAQFFEHENPGHVFVKNLETVQGDQRDVIFISIGYGRDSRGGGISRNFGPVNKDGGERRLNVLFTRARERVVVYCNFRPGEFNVGDNPPRGIQILKMFLEYAESGRLPELEVHEEDTESPFEDAVKAFLQDHGHTVHSQVGQSGYRIDLAVVDPRNVGRHAIGIECDGATYHSSRVARARDRLREQELRKNGWQIHRIWSTDWFLNRKDAQARLLDAVEKAIAGTVAPSPFQPQLMAEREDDEIVVNVGQSGATLRAAGIEYSFEAYPEPTIISGFVSAGVFDSSPKELALVIAEIANHEGPVMLDVVIERIARHAGAGRSGSRIRAAIENAAKVAAYLGLIKLHRRTVSAVGARQVVPRARAGPELDINRVPPEEIEAALLQLLRANQDCQAEELVAGAARAFGFQRVKETTKEPIARELERLVKQGKIVVANGVCRPAAEK